MQIIRNIKNFPTPLIFIQAGPVENISMMIVHGLIKILQNHNIILNNYTHLTKFMALGGVFYEFS